MKEGWSPEGIVVTVDFSAKTERWTVKDSVETADS